MIGHIEHAGQETLSERERIMSFVSIHNLKTLALVNTLGNLRSYADCSPNDETPNRQTASPVVEKNYQRTASVTLAGTTGKIRSTSVAAHLRSLRSDDPLSKGHPRPIKQRLKL